MPLHLEPGPENVHWGYFDARLAPLLTPALVEAVVTAVPAEWLERDADGEDARRAYVEYLLRRLEPPRGFVEEADAARRRP